jgi:hypothetical protein
MSNRAAKKRLRNIVKFHGLHAFLVTIRPIFEHPKYNDNKNAKK